MAKEEQVLLAFNRGLIHKQALARVDLKRTGLSASQMTNWMPRVLGPMGIREGLKYIGTIGANRPRMLPFVHATDDKALIELTPSTMRIWVNDALVTRVAVATTIANGNFTSNITSWTDQDEGGISPGATWHASGYASLQGDGTNASALEQFVAVGGDAGQPHAIRIVVVRGGCYIRAGIAAGGQGFLTDTFLYPGTHSIVITPTADFYLRIFSRAAYPVLIDSVNIEAGGTLSLPTPWTTQAQLQNVRSDQSGDIVFVACEGLKPKCIERRDDGSWSVVDYVAPDGPFRIQNVSTITMAPGALTGATTLTASADVFKTDHVGALFKLLSVGQNLSTAIGSAAFTEPIRVTGTGTGRAFTYQVSGTWVGTVALQRSVGAIGAWTDVTTTTVNVGPVAYNDTFDNQIIYYRLGFTAWTSGTATLAMNYAVGTNVGVGRVTAYTSPTQVSIDTLNAFGSLTATVDWSEGDWSDYRGYPSAVALHTGRLWWAGKDKQWGSVVDSYYSHDDDYVGDAGPISRSIGSGPVDKIQWMVSADKLTFGAQAAEWTVRSSALDEPITPTNYNLQSYTKRGSANVPGVVIDDNIIFVDRSGQRVFETANNGEGGKLARHLTALVLDFELASPAFSRVAVQRNPDTRIHFVRETDAKAAVLVYDTLEEVSAWVQVETDGNIRDVVIIPRADEAEDEVYYVVERSGVFFLEEFSRATENMLVDSGVSATSGTTTLSGLSHLEGKQVVVQDKTPGNALDDVDTALYTVSGGSITIPSVGSGAYWVGLPYRARFKSVKLAQEVSALGKTMRVNHISLILSDTHRQGLRYGPDFDNMDELPLVERGVEDGDLAAGAVWSEYDEGPVEFNGVYDTNGRICLEAQSPRRCVVLAVNIDMERI